MTETAAFHYSLSALWKSAIDADPLGKPAVRGIAQRKFCDERGYRLVYSY